MTMKHGEPERGIVSDFPPRPQDLLSTKRKKRKRKRYSPSSSFTNSFFHLFTLFCCCFLFVCFVLFFVVFIFVFLWGGSCLFSFFSWSSGYRNEGKEKGEKRGCVLWHINLFRLFNAKSCWYICINIFD